MLGQKFRSLESYYVKSASVGCQASVVRGCLGEGVMMEGVGLLFLVLKGREKGCNEGV